MRPTVVHTHSSKAGVLGRVAARLARVPVVVHTIEGLPFHRYAAGWQNALYIAAERVAARACDRIAVVAQAMADQAVAAGVADPEQFTPIYSGMDVDAYLQADPLRGSVRRRWGIGPDEIVIGKIARLFDLKGHEFVLRAAPRVIGRCPRARFLFVGGGALREDLGRMARRLGVADHVTFTGLVPPQDIPGLVSAMDIVVHASLREGLARVLVQGLLCAKPVVTYDLDGAPEVIVNQETGRLVPAESVDELADAVLEIALHPRRGRAMGREGRRRFAERFRIETMVSDTERLYRELMAQKGVGGG
jgi:glycosyltransferase involved in cell wall biosynthesis